MLYLWHHVMYTIWWFLIGRVNYSDFHSRPTTVAVESSDWFGRPQLWPSQLRNGNPSLQRRPQTTRQESQWWHSGFRESCNWEVGVGSAGAESWYGENGIIQKKKASASQPWTGKTLAQVIGLIRCLINLCIYPLLYYFDYWIDLFRPISCFRKGQFIVAMCWVMVPLYWLLFVVTY